MSDDPRDWYRPTTTDDKPTAYVAQSSAGQIFSMILAPLRSVILALGQRWTAAAKVARARSRSFTPARCS
jgi:hypothetical protein